MSDQAAPLLRGLKILSFCHYLQGPAASQYLADMGADVVKVEPLGGAFERRWSGADTYVDGISAFFLCGNRNKRSLTVDLKQPEGRALILRLLEQYDAVVENYRPGVMERLGLGYEDVKKVNPKIVYASASGFGSAGPMANRPGQDLLVQAYVGLVAATGSAQTAPTAVGCAAVDQHGAALLAMGILGGYVRALRTGVGTRIEASLLNAGLDLQAEALTLYYSGQQNADILDRDPHLATWFHQAPYGVYRTADAFVVLSLNDLTALSRALDDPAFTALLGRDPYTERDLFAKTVADILAERDFADVATVFDARGIWYQRVQTYDDLRNDPHLLYNEVFRDISIGDETATLINHPLRYDGQVPGLRHLALTAGVHTNEILTENGFSAEEIAQLTRVGVITNPQEEGRVP